MIVFQGKKGKSQVAPAKPVNGAQDTTSGNADPVKAASLTQDVETQV